MGPQCIAVADNFCRQTNVRIRCFHAENLQIRAAPMKQRPELPWFSVQFRIRRWLRPAAVESPV